MHAWFWSIVHRGGMGINMVHLERFFQKVSDWLGYTALFFMGFLMVGTTLDVLVRAIRGRSISGVFELAELSMVLVVILGLGWTKLDDAHIRVTMLTTRMPVKALRFFETLAWGFAALLLLFLAIPASEDAIHSFAIREFRWGYIEFPIWWAKIILALGLWFGFFQMLFASVQTAVFGVSKTPAALLQAEIAAATDGPIRE